MCCANMYNKTPRQEPFSLYVSCYIIKGTHPKVPVYEYKPLEEFRSHPAVETHAKRKKPNELHLICRLRGPLLLLVENNMIRRKRTEDQGVTECLCTP